MLRNIFVPLPVAPALLLSQPITVPVTNTSIRAALATLRADNAWTLEQQTSIREIAAPPF